MFRVFVGLFSLFIVAWGKYTLQVVNVAKLKALCWRIKQFYQWFLVPTSFSGLTKFFFCFKFVWIPCMNSVETVYNTFCTLFS